jgi:hypothetical protein
MSQYVIGSRETLDRYVRAIEDEPDDLAAARGLMNGLVLGLATWALIAWIVVLLVA